MLVVSKELADKFRTEKDSPYVRFVRNEGLDIIGAQYVPNLRTVDLKPWPRAQTPKASSSTTRHSRYSNDCYVCEIAPGQKLEPQHHLYEEMIMVLTGRGSTTVWNNAGARITFEWKAGSIFAIPLNCWYQHFNGSGQDVVRFVARDQRSHRSSTATTISISSSTARTTSSNASPASRTISAPRASRTASCCAPISCRTPSTCR